jgi:hypothetical protein
MLDPFSEEVRIDELRGAEGGSEDVDAVVVRPFSIAAMV